MLLAAPLFRVRHAPRDVILQLDEGDVGILHAGMLSQHVRATDALAASTARTARGVAIAIQRKTSPERPLILDFATDEDLRRVRQALGIGYFGFGEIAWPAVRSVAETLRSAALALSAAGWMTMAIAAAFGRAGICLGLALAAVPFTLAVLPVIAAARPGRPGVKLSPHGLTVLDRAGKRKSTTYAEISDIKPGEHCFRVLAREGPLVVPTEEMLDEEREHLGAQIVSAIQRARGDGPVPPGLAPSLALLAPHHEAKRAWLERIDATAASLSEGGAYRRGALETTDLWATLESPDAPVPLRAAAARVLARVEPEQSKTRIAGVLATVRDAHARAWIRVALEEDVEEAARQMDRMGG